MIRIFKVGLEHVKHGDNWSTKNVEARTATEAIRKAQRGEPRSVRPVSVQLLAEAEA